MEFMQNDRNTPTEKVDHMLEQLQINPPENSRLFLKALEEEDQRSGHEGLAKTIRTKLQ